MPASSPQAGCCQAKGPWPQRSALLQGPTSTLEQQKRLQLKIDSWLVSTHQIAVGQSHTCFKSNWWTSQINQQNTKIDSGGRRCPETRRQWTRGWFSPGDIATGLVFIWTRIWHKARGCFWHSGQRRGLNESWHLTFWQTFSYEWTGDWSSAKDCSRTYVFLTVKV